jgi:pilus assembly protein CpaB
MLTITLAAVLGLLGVVAVVAYAHQANQRAVAGLKPATIWIADTAIPAGTSLKMAKGDGSLISETVPAKSVSTDAVHSVSSNNGHMRVNATMAKGQVLLTTMLTSSLNANNSGNFVIPTGMVAVAVNMCVDEAVADYLSPGSDIAVFDTVANGGIQRSCEPQHASLSFSQLTTGHSVNTLLFLPKAEVLAVGQNPAAQSSSRDNIPTTTEDPSANSSGEVLVTVAVKETDAQHLILMEEVGMPYMVLLGPGAKMTYTLPGPLFHLQQP